MKRPGSAKIIKKLQWYLENELLTQDERASIENTIHIFRAIVLTETARRNDETE